MKIIVKKFFGWDEPGTPYYHSHQPSEEPVTVRRTVGEAAIEAGCAEEHQPSEEPVTVRRTVGEAGCAEEHKSKRKLKGDDNGES